MFCLNLISVNTPTKRGNHDHIDHILMNWSNKSTNSLLSAHLYLGEHPDEDIWSGKGQGCRPEICRARCKVVMVMTTMMLIEWMSIMVMIMMVIVKTITIMTIMIMLTMIHAQDDCGHGKGGSRQENSRREVNCAGKNAKIYEDTKGHKDIKTKPTTMNCSWLNIRLFRWKQLRAFRTFWGTTSSQGWRIRCGYKCLKMV